MFSEGIMPAWTSESTVVKSSWMVAVGSVTGEGITGKGEPCLEAEPVAYVNQWRSSTTALCSMYTPNLYNVPV
jgi:hypothetical protein